MMNKKEKSKQRILKGVVVSDKMDKTIVVSVSRIKKHPKYQKRYKVDKKYKVDDKENKYKSGDRVIIRESRPISKDKKWIIATEYEKHTNIQKIKNKK